jgi:hypothetical protein
MDAVDGAGAGHGVDQHGEEGGKKCDEHHRERAYAEPQDRERHPRERRNWSEDAEQAVEQTLDRAVEPHGKADRHTERERPDICVEDTRQARLDVAQEFAIAGRADEEAHHRHR